MGAHNCCSGSNHSIGVGDGLSSGLPPGMAPPTGEEEGLSFSSHSLPSCVGIDSRYGKRISLKPATFGNGVTIARSGEAVESVLFLPDADTDVPDERTPDVLAPAFVVCHTPRGAAIAKEKTKGEAAKLQSCCISNLGLVVAARSDDAVAVLQHIGSGNASAMEIGEALRSAARYGCADAVRELVALGIDVNYEGTQQGSDTGFTPLQLAASGGHFIVCEQLLDALADVERRREGTPSSLELSRQYGHHEVAGALLAHKQGNLKDEPEKPPVLRMDEKVWEAVREFRPQPGPPVQRARRFRGEGDQDGPP